MAKIAPLTISLFRSMMIKDDRVLLAYVKYHHALIELLYNKNDSIGASLLKLILERGSVLY